MESIGCLDLASKGSGTKTALIAAALAWGYRDRPTTDALLVAANLLGSDTDTIATMAGAILGAVARSVPPEPILDRDYIEKEAGRLYAISVGNESLSFCYPDLMRWSPPKNQASAVGKLDNRIAVAGLGTATASGETFPGQGQERSVWQWLRLDLGQTVIAKRRADLSELSRSASCIPVNGQKVKTGTPEQNSLFPHNSDPMSPAQEEKTTRTLDAMTNDAIKAGFDPAVIGRHIIELSSANDGIERCLAYVAIISKARKARLTQRRP